MTYIWKCIKCEKHTEVDRKMSDYQIPPDTTCECGANEYERVIDRSNFILKGEGWYHNSYTSTGKPIK